MKLIIQIIAHIIPFLSLPIIIELSKYIKKHGTELVDEHESYIITRFKLIYGLIICSAVLSLIALLL